MRVKLLIATTDESYAEHLSNYISAHHSDVIDVTVCRTPERFGELLESSGFDSALLDETMVEAKELDPIRLPMLLCAEDRSVTEAAEALRKIRKYQRVSSIVAEVLEHFAKVSPGGLDGDSVRANVTAVWSPAGGVGKTSVALAYTSRKASDGKQALYLNLESFSSIPAYFSETGKSISTAFEMLGSNEGSITTLIQSIRKHDKTTGVFYLCHPSNFDDMNILSPEDIAALISACAAVTDELVIDMSCVCDERTRRVFELADKVFIVIDQAQAVQAKLLQFSSQHNVYTRIKPKVSLIANKGAVSFEPLTDNIIWLPFVQSSREDSVFKVLSGSCFDTIVTGAESLSSG